MISIRTGLVAAAFVAMGLTSVAERWVDRMGARAAAPAASDRAAPVGRPEAPATLRLTRRGPGVGPTRRGPMSRPAKPDTAPWI